MHLLSRQQSALGRQRRQLRSKKLSRGHAGNAQRITATVGSALFRAASRPALCTHVFTASRRLPLFYSLATLTYGGRPTLMDEDFPAALSHSPSVPSIHSFRFDSSPDKYQYTFIIICPKLPSLCLDCRCVWTAQIYAVFPSLFVRQLRILFFRECDPVWVLAICTR